MGMLDGLLGGLMGSGGGTQGQSPLVAMALQVIQQNGGLPGIISKFQHGGLTDHVDSWVGTGQNLPMNGNQLREILGSGTIGQIAEQVGMSHSDASSGLAQVLPELINRLTPTGQVPENHSEMLNQVLAALSKRTA
ncbi:MAG TPA: YidB family protein [Casimicrobiaceae bacterium]|jgi:uncharacterized protein YidB (DUF937 family)